MSAHLACLPFVGTSRCGYCGQHLTQQPEGDWACSPCREVMARMISPAANYEQALAQFRAFQQAVAPKPTRRRTPAPSTTGENR